MKLKLDESELADVLFCTDTSKFTAEDWETILVGDMCEHIELTVTRYFYDPKDVDTVLEFEASLLGHTVDVMGLDCSLGKIEEYVLENLI